MIIDTHSHLVYDNVKTDEILKNMQDDKLEKIVTVGVDVENSIESQKLAESNKNVYCVVGIHPEYASEATDEDIKKIDELATKNKVVGIGEIGLDYHYTQDNIEKQKDIFIKQIKIANKHGLPVCIHTRDAKEDTYEILKNNQEYLKNGGVMHCYSYDNEYAKKFIDLGFYISFAGNFTYKKNVSELIKDLPIDKIVVETDSPFLTPVPFRGKTNEPKFIHYTAQKIADELKMDLDLLEEKLLTNTYKLFKKMKRD